MDSKRLTEIEERCEKATTAPWKTNAGDFDDWLVCSLGCSNQDDEDYHVTTENCRASELYGDAKWDADFIAHARTDLPDLVAAYKLLRADAAELARALQALKNKTEAIAKAVDPYIALASLRAGEDIYMDGPKMQPEVSQADELLSRPSVVNLLKEKDQ